jgi:hypothetical protein
MACLITNGIARDCGFSFGGLKKMYIAPKANVITIGKNQTTNVITGITLQTGDTKFFAYEFEPNTAQLLQELQTGSASRFVNQTVNGQFAKITQVKKETLEDLANAEVVVIVQDQADIYWLAGEYGTGLLAASLTIDSGLAQADAYVGNISLVGGSLGYANQVTSSIIAALLV